MRYALFFGMLVALILACSSARKSASSSALEITSEDSVAGKETVMQSDCYTCHKIEEKLIGPSFLDIAGKYEKNRDHLEQLSKKIRNGGSGSWGMVPMVPHNDLSQEKTDQIVKYIFSLKN